jgi:hypothetical protein
VHALKASTAVARAGLTMPFMDFVISVPTAELGGQSRPYCRRPTPQRVPRGRPDADQPSAIAATGTPPRSRALR